MIMDNPYVTDDDDLMCRSEKREGALTHVCQRWEGHKGDDHRDFSTGRQWHNPEDEHT